MGYQVSYLGINIHSILNIYHAFSDFG